MLSLLHQEGGHCLWRQVDPETGSIADRPRAEIAGACTGIRLAWSPDGRKAALSSSIGLDLHPAHEIWEVVGNDRAVRLPFPPGNLREVGYGPDSQLQAFSMEFPLTPGTMESFLDGLLGRSTHYQSRASTLRYTGNHWQVTETITHPYTTPLDFVDELPSFATLGTHTPPLAAPGSTEQVGQQSAQRAARRAQPAELPDGILPQIDPEHLGNWFPVQGCLLPVYWDERSSKTWVMRKEQLQEVFSIPGQLPTFWAPTCRGRFLLLRNRAPVEMWDLESFQPILESDGEAVFWPQATASRPPAPGG